MTTTLFTLKISTIRNKFSLLTFNFLTSFHNYQWPTKMIIPLPTHNFYHFIQIGPQTTLYQQKFHIMMSLMILNSLFKNLSKKKLKRNSLSSNTQRKMLNPTSSIKFSLFWALEQKANQFWKKFFSQVKRKFKTFMNY